MLIRGSENFVVRCGDGRDLTGIDIVGFANNGLWKTASFEVRDHTGEVFLTSSGDSKMKVVDIEMFRRYGAA